MIFSYFFAQNIDYGNFLDQPLNEEVLKSIYIMFRMPLFLLDI